MKYSMMVKCCLCDANYTFAGLSESTLAGVATPPEWAMFRRAFSSQASTTDTLICPKHTITASHNGDTITLKSGDPA